MILDTCFLIDLLRKNKNAIIKLQEITADKEQLFITSLTIYELFRGIKKDEINNKNRIKLDYIRLN